MGRIIIYNIIEICQYLLSLKKYIYIMYTLVYIEWKNDLWKLKQCLIFPLTLL